MANNNVQSSSSQKQEDSFREPPMVPQLSFPPPVITAAMLPRPDPSMKQSVEEWFTIFKAVADNLIEIYKSANQEVVGQRQALAAIPALLNRTEAESRLAVRVLSECATLAEAGVLIRQAVGSLESECQASEAIINMKRGNKSLEDFYALLVEKDKKALLGTTFVIKKFIAELPESIKITTRKQFRKLSEQNPGEFTK